ncbi:MAG: HD domain-containing protein [Bacteroidetes bacterium]|nr:HD domain-containing protein [Bacteroidota bacterium]
MERIILLEEIPVYVRLLFDTYATADLHYHNLEHTTNVVQHISRIAAHYNIDEQDLFMLISAGWFHDTGHLLDVMAGHEEVSAQLMTDFMRTREVPEPVISRITDLILATRFPTHPVNLLQEIICDADTWHFGTPAFRETDSLIRLELIARLKKPMQHWHEKSLQLLKEHIFYTAYCRSLLDAGKKQNIEWLQSLTGA